MCDTVIIIPQIFLEDPHRPGPKSTSTSKKKQKKAAPYKQALTKRNPEGLGFLPQDYPPVTTAQGCQKDSSGLKLKEAVGWGVGDYRCSGKLDPS